MKSVSIILPSYHRGHLLHATLESIRVQDFPDTEIVVVEDDRDDLTEKVATRFGAKYFHYERSEVFPPWQSVATVFNRGVHESTGDVLILSAPETKHGDSVIESLVSCVADDSKKLAIAKTHLLGEDGKVGAQLGFSAGASPRAIQRVTVDAVGGFENGFFGYGYEDDFFDWILQQNGVTEQRVNATAYHQWHSSVPGGYEPFTGHSNRALCWALVREIEWGMRPPRANFGPLIHLGDTNLEIVKRLIPVAHKLFHHPIYDRWVTSSLMNVDDNLDARNTAASFAKQDSTFAAQIACDIAEAFWMLQWADKCAKEIGKTDSVSWQKRLEICHSKFMACAKSAIWEAKKLLNGERPPFRH